MRLPGQCSRPIIGIDPQETVDKEQSWFWQEKWQNLEAEAEADVREGRVKSFASVEKP
jgi:antitoxin MazE